MFAKIKASHTRLAIYFVRFLTVAKAMTNFYHIFLCLQDVTDLFGTDLPVEGGEGGQFAWRDGPLLRALRAGHWVVLDEVIINSSLQILGDFIGHSEVECNFRHFQYW